MQEFLCGVFAGLFIYFILDLLFPKKKGNKGGKMRYFIAVFACNNAMCRVTFPFLSYPSEEETNKICRTILPVDYVEYSVHVLSIQEWSKEQYEAWIAK